ncbi:MAG: serpin family protein [Saprospiraceae bacterium]
MKSTKRLIISFALILFSVLTFAQVPMKEGSIQFSFDMYKKLKTTNKNDNIFFSPMSVSNAFAVPYVAASGLTKQQIQGVFYYDDNPKKNLKKYKDFSRNLERSNDVTISLANSLWIDEKMPINPSFQKNVKQFTGRDEIHKVSFTKNHKACRSQINQWVEDNTEKNIKNLIPEKGINELTRFVMTNAVYFKGDWKTKFDDDFTATNNFYGLEKVIPTQFMTKAVTDHFYYENDQVQILELPYKGESTSMVIVLPRFENGLATLENNLSVATYNKWLNVMTKRPVVVSMPKFNMKIQYDLRSTFRKMDLKEPFTDAAAFDNMTPKGGLKLTKVYHQSFIVVSESGTEAAGATVVQSDVKGPKPKPAYFNANQPFLFFIKDNETNMILFMGRLTKPSFSEEVTYSNEQPPRFPPVVMPKSDKIHFVEKGESLYGISKKYGVAMEQIKTLNKMTSNGVKIGQELLIQEGEKGGNVEPTPIIITQSNDTHEVYPGESLFSISRKYKLSVDKLKALNGMSDNTIKIGQKLVVKENTQKSPTSTSTPKPEPKPIFVSQKTYKVKKGDTLWKIATQHQLSVSQLKKMNDLTNNVVNIGQELKVK